MSPISFVDFPFSFVCFVFFHFQKIFFCAVKKLPSDNWDYIVDNWNYVWDNLKYVRDIFCCVYMCWLSVAWRVTVFVCEESLWCMHFLCFFGFCIQSGLFLPQSCCRSRVVWCRFFILCYVMYCVLYCIVLFQGLCVVFCGCYILYNVYVFCVFCVRCFSIYCVVIFLRFFLFMWYVWFSCSCICFFVFYVLLCGKKSCMNVWLWKKFALLLHSLSGTNGARPWKFLVKREFNE